MTIMTELEAPSVEERIVPAAPPEVERLDTPARLVSLDAYRGLVMVLMVSAGLRIGDVVKNFEKTPELRHLKTPLWERLAFHTDHVAWVGCALWDLIQPSFMFMVGTAMAFSLASRRAKGHSFGRMFGHAIFRSLALIFLSILLISNWSKGTEWVFTNVLAQVGLGYTFLFLVAWLKPRWQLVTAISILLLYWAAFAVYPKPAANFNFASVGLPADWQHLRGFAAHWEKNTNVASAFDRWWLNLFPRPASEPFRPNAPGYVKLHMVVSAARGVFGLPTGGGPFRFSTGGYATLNFIPSLVTMIFGLLAGGLIRSRKSAGFKLVVTVAAGAAGLAAGWWLDRLGICPLVKRIWTPSWTLFSGGWVFLSLAVFYLVIDVARLKAWAYPLVVVGMNSIAVYCISMILKPWVRETMDRHLGKSIYTVFGKAYAPMMDATYFLLVCWLVCWWMYRKKIFIKI